MPSDPAPNQPPPSNQAPRRKQPPSMGGNWIWLLVLVMLGLVFLAPSISSYKEIPWSTFYELIAEGQLKEVVQVGDRYQGEVKDKNKIPDKYKEKIPKDGKFMVERLQGNDLPLQQLLAEQAKKGELAVQAKPTYTAWLNLLYMLLPVIVILALFFV